MGHLSLYLAEGGASRVLAAASERMLSVARSERPHERVEYRLCAMEDLELPPKSFDLVISSLALHYVADHATLVRKIALWLRPGRAPSCTPSSTRSRRLPKIPTRTG